MEEIERLLKQCYIDRKITEAKINMLIDLKEEIESRHREEVSDD